MRTMAFILSGLGGVALASAVVAETPFEESRSVLEQWAETRRLISTEKADWATGKEVLQRQIDLLEKENQLLDEQIAKAAATTTQAEKEQQALLDENEALSVASASVRTTVLGLEKRVRELAKFFPPPLTERIEPLFRRIPAAAEATAKSSLGERMQNVVGILSEVDKFNNTVTVVTELKQSPQGNLVQVKTIYLGLAAAYFVDNAARFAGAGSPAENGWQWTPDNTIAERVAQVLYMYENSAAAAFVNLPVHIE